jgi:hypothetical protein
MRSRLGARDREEGVKIETEGQEKGSWGLLHGQEKARGLDRNYWKGRDKDEQYK